MFREIRGVGWRVTELKEETVAARKRDSSGSEVLEVEGGWEEVMRVTGWGTWRIRCRRWEERVSSCGCCGCEGGCCCVGGDVVVVEEVGGVLLAGVTDECLCRLAWHWNGWFLVGE